MLDQETFFKEHYIDPEEFRACGISWEELCAIYDSYVSIEEHLRDLGKEFVDAYLYDIEKAGIHSYRYRTKDPEHLLEKIIRKRSEDPERFADIDRYNYHKYMTDLIGIRVFFRNDPCKLRKFIGHTVAFRLGAVHTGAAAAHAAQYTVHHG